MMCTANLSNSCASFFPGWHRASKGYRCSDTVGRPGMSLLELCIFVADATEPNREDYEGLPEIRALSEVSLAAAALKSMQYTQKFLERTGRPFFPIALDTMNDLESRLSPEIKIKLNQPI